MKPTLLANALSVRANKCLALAGIPVEKEAVRRALEAGVLFPFLRPALYGKKTHQEVCRWAGLKETFLPTTIPKGTGPRVVDNGLSYRANHCLHRAGIPAEKEAVRNAIQTGLLSPGKSPFNYGPDTHAELSLWAAPISPPAPHQP